MMTILKRYVAPKFWRIKTKEKKFVVSLSPGPHNKKSSMPLLVVIRDIFAHAQTAKEAKEIINKGLVKINGVIKKDYRFPVGLMDTVSIGKENYLMLPSRKGLTLQPVGKQHTEKRLLKIVGKTVIKKGKIQLRLHTGETMLVDDNSLKTGSVIILGAGDKKIHDVLKSEPDNVAIITTGRNIGMIGKIKKIIITKGSGPNKAILEIDGKEIDVPRDYLFVVGKEKPIIPIAKEL